MPLSTFFLDGEIDTEEDFDEDDDDDDDEPDLGDDQSVASVNVAMQEKQNCPKASNLNLHSHMQLLEGPLPDVLIKYPMKHCIACGAKSPYVIYHHTKYGWRVCAKCMSPTEILAVKWALQERLEWA